MAVVPADEFADAALVAHRVEALLLRLVLRTDARVGDGNVQTRVQERLFPHPCVQRLIVVFERVEHLRVGFECDLRPVLVRCADDAHFLGDMAARELHLVDVPFLRDLNFQPLRERIDHARAHAMQTAGDFISPAAEFAARVQHRVDDFQRGPTGLCLNVDRDAASVVLDRDGVALVDRHLDVMAIARQRLVDRVVDDLIDEVVQSGGARRADVHARPLTHSLQPLQYLDLAGVIFRLDHVIFQYFFAHSVYSFPKGYAARSRAVSNRRVSTAALYFVR